MKVNKIECDLGTGYKIYVNPCCDNSDISFHGNGSGMFVGRLECVSCGMFVEGDIWDNGVGVLDNWNKVNSGYESVETRRDSSGVYWTTRCYDKPVVKTKTNLDELSQELMSR